MNKRQKKRLRISPESCTQVHSFPEIQENYENPKSFCSEELIEKYRAYFRKNV